MLLAKECSPGNRRKRQLHRMMTQLIYLRRKILMISSMRKVLKKVQDLREKKQLTS